MSEPNRILVDEAEESRSTKTEDPDLELVRCAQGGEESAFTALWTLHKTFITAVVNQRLQSCDDVPEVVQDVFINAFRSIGKFRCGSKFSTWLYKIAKNRCNDYLRAKCRMRVQLIPLEETAECAHPPRWNEDTSTKMAIVEKVLGQMDPKKQEIIQRVFWDGEPKAEIAADLGMKPQQVRDAVKAFLRKLWREIEVQSAKGFAASRSK